MGNVLRAYWFDRELAILQIEDESGNHTTPKSERTLERLRRKHPTVDEQLNVFANRPRPQNFKSQGLIPPMTEDQVFNRQGIRQ